MISSDVYAKRQTESQFANSDYTLKVCIVVCEGIVASLLKN